MSNRVTLQRTVFCNYNTRDKTFGFRIYDDMGQTYGNYMEEKELKKSDKDFFNYVCDFGNDRGSSEMIDWALEYGCYIDDTWHEVKELLEWRGLDFQ